jgi:hypothetical protein
MDRKLANKNIRTGMWLATFSLFMFGLSFVVAALYLS